jgi:caffeoyl-CoA O-methyltransferase
VTVGLWQPVDPRNDVVEEIMTPLPWVFWRRGELWKDFLALVDTTASHPEVWGFLSQMVNATGARVIVEAGTYRGHGCFAMAEALLCTGQEGHIWSADIVDHHVDDALRVVGLSEYVSLAIGKFDEMVEEQIAEPIDLAFVDASDPNNSMLRVDYVDFLYPRMRKGGLIVVDDCGDVEGWPSAQILRDTCNLYLPLGRGTCVFQV